MRTSARFSWRSLPLVLALLLAGAAPLGFPAPGARAVGEGGWQTLYTPHLRVHFQGGYEAAAIEAARAGEEAVSRLADRLGHTPEAPIHLVLIDVSDLANGYTDVAYYGRIVIFPAFPAGLAYTTGLSPRMSDWIRLVVTHEVVHAVHLDMAEGLAQGLRQVFGHVPGLSTPNAFQPAAFLEGLATFEETEMVQGGRGRDPLFDMFLRTAVLESSLPPMGEALGSYDLGKFQPAGHVYLYGYTWFDYVNRRFGGDAIREMQKSFAGFGAGRPGDVVRQVTGEELESVWSGMREQLERRFREQAEAIRARGATEAQLVEGARASGAWVAVSPRVSPDGRWLAYAASGPFVEDLRVIDLTTGAERQLAVALTTAPGGLDWSRDGQRLIYAAADDAGGRLFSDLYSVELSTGRVQRLTRGLRAYAPAAGPGGAVAFIAREGLKTRVMVRQPAGSELLLWDPPEGWQLLGLAWDPQGERLAVSAWKPGGGSDLVILRVRQGGEEVGGGRTFAVEGVERVTADPAADDRPAWSADGRYLFFHSDRDGVYNLYAYDTAAGGLFRLTNVLTGAFDPAQSPDGKSLYFSWFGSAGYRLARLDAAQLRWEPVAYTKPAGDGSVTTGPPGSGGRAAGAATGTPALPASWRVGPYRAVESLRPTYWEPLYGGDWPGPFLGASTSGLDALGRQAYAAAAAVGLVTGAPLLYGAYAAAPGGPESPVMLIEASITPQPDAPSQEPLGPWTPYAEVGALAAQVSWQRSGYTSGQGAALGAARFWSRRVWPVPEGWASAPRDTLVAGSLSIYRIGGDHRAVNSRRWQLDGALFTEVDSEPVHPLHGAQLTARWAYRRRTTSGSGLQLRLSAGATGGVLSLTAGGDGEPFGLRAFSPEKLDASAAAVGVGAEQEWRLAALQYALGDTPTFLDALSLALFSEAAAGWDRQGARERPPLPTDSLTWAAWSPAADVGAELRLYVTLDYGRAPIVLRLGVAQGIRRDQALPTTRWYLTLEAR